MGSASAGRCFASAIRWRGRSHTTYTGRFCPGSSASVALRSRHPVLRPGKKIGGGMERNRMIRAAALALLVSVIALPTMSQAQTLADAMVSAVKSSTELRSEEHTSELQSRGHLVCRLLLEKKTNE